MKLKEVFETGLVFESKKEVKEKAVNYLMLDYVIKNTHKEELSIKELKNWIENGFDEEDLEKFIFQEG